MRHFWKGRKFVTPMLIALSLALCTGCGEDPMGDCSQELVNDHDAILSAARSRDLNTARSALLLFESKHSGIKCRAIDRESGNEIVVRTDERIAEYKRRLGM